MDRRTFLQSVAGLGLAALLPGSVGGTLDDDEVEQAWRELERSPLEFEVVYDRTLVIAGYPEPQTRLDVFSLDESCIDSPEALAMEIHYCYPLASHVGRVCSEIREDALLAFEDALDHDELTPAERKRRVDAEAARWPDPEDADELSRWLAALDEEAFARVAASVAGWLNDAPDWNWESDYFSDYADGQSAALAFFRQQPNDVLDALGVVIVEGEHPGSSYYAAELLVSVDEANELAARHDIPVRFAAV